MATEKALALVVRFTDWSETSRIATLWTRQFGRVRVLAKGGRRLKSNFEASLDLLAVCDIVFIRKSTPGLDLLTEARLSERFPKLTAHLPALNAGYYVAELLSDWTEDYDPHPALFDAALATLRDLGDAGSHVGLRLARFELDMLQELGYSPALDVCPACGRAVSDKDGTALCFSPAIGGMLCRSCEGGHRDRLAVSPGAWRLLKRLRGTPEAWRDEVPVGLRGEVRRLLDLHVTYLMGRRPRLLPYVASNP